MQQIITSLPVFVEVDLQLGNKVSININQINHIRQTTETNSVLVYLNGDAEPLYIKGDYDAFIKKANLQVI